MEVKKSSKELVNDLLALIWIVVIVIDIMAVIVSVWGVALHGSGDGRLVIMFLAVSNLGVFISILGSKDE